MKAVAVLGMHAPSHSCNPIPQGSGCPWRACSQQFNHTSHQFEIRLERESTVEYANDEDSSRIPQIIYNVRA